MAEIIWAPSALKDITAIAAYISNDSVWGVPSNNKKERLVSGRQAITCTG